ncbi:hypothetical protein J8M20_04570 [Pseudoalteromonas luteoviolacea]|uniref:DUF6950 family protein n=1 Tax=Pseudoalteromonas luteoviolacea TaxID=43657 RepID=UPI001B3882B1|nr:hypothetical protein [Pseudoalteromonas luteoviolacea]MBQ4810593.1 hypothetical protein [Pseudoalteromonas luteoviolacea]
MLTADAVVDVAAGFRGHYTAAIGAKRRLTRLGFSDFQSVFKHHLKPIEIDYAQHAAIALVDFISRPVNLC